MITTYINYKPNFHFRLQSGKCSYEFNCLPKNWDSICWQYTERQIFVKQNFFIWTVTVFLITNHLPYNLEYWILKVLTGRIVLSGEIYPRWWMSLQFLWSKSYCKYLSLNYLQFDWTHMIFSCRHPVWTLLTNLATTHIVFHRGSQPCSISSSILPTFSIYFTVPFVQSYSLCRYFALLTHP